MAFFRSDPPVADPFGKPQQTCGLCREPMTVYLQRTDATPQGVYVGVCRTCDRVRGGSPPMNLSIKESAVYWHEMYTSLVEAGFTATEALCLTAQQMTVNSQIQAAYLMWRPTSE